MTAYKNILMWTLLDNLTAKKHLSEKTQLKKAATIIWRQDGGQNWRLGEPPSLKIQASLCPSCFRLPEVSWGHQVGPCVQEGRSGNGKESPQVIQELGEQENPQLLVLSDLHAQETLVQNREVWSWDFWQVKASSWSLASFGWNQMTSVLFTSTTIKARSHSFPFLCIPTTSSASPRQLTGWW